MIDLTESEVVAANLRALGVQEEIARPSEASQRVYDTYVEMMRETGSLVTLAAVAARLGINASAVSRHVQALVREGRMLETTSKRTARTVYVPVVVAP